MLSRTIRSALFFAALLAASTPGARAQAFTVPSGTPTTTQTSEPFGKGPGRFQQILSGQAISIGPANLNQLSFRAHGPAATAHRLDLELGFGYAAKAPSVMSTTFVDNIAGSLQKVVSRRNVNLPALPGAGGFNVNFPFDQPFVYAGTGNLLFDLTIYNNDNGNQPFFYDLSLAFSPQVSYVSTYTSPLAPTGVRQLNQGMWVSIGYSQATFTPFGKGCPGEGAYVPAISNVGFPRIGQPFQVLVGNITGSRNTWLIFGRSRSAWGPVPLPFDLSGFGATGCNLYVDMVILSPVLSQGGQGGTGYSSATIFVPAFPGFVGVDLLFQWMIHAPGANPIDLSFSDGAISRIDI